MRLKLRKIGNSYGVILPQNVIENMHLQPGDELHASDTEDGLILTPYDPHFDEALEAYEGFARQYKNALKKLAE